MVTLGVFLPLLGLMIPTVLKAGAKIFLKRELPTLAKNATKYFVKKGVNKLDKKFKASESSGKTLTNNEITDIIKAIKSLENRGILLIKTT